MSLFLKKGIYAIFALATAEREKVRRFCLRCDKADLSAILIWKTAVDLLENADRWISLLFFN